jgi:hypothetical protein
VPSFNFTYFDLNKKDYVRLSSPEYSITVSGQASTVSTQNISGIKKEEVELLGEDIRFIHLNATFKEKNERFFGTPVFMGLCAAPLLLFFGLLIYKKRDDELKGNKTLLKKMQANKVATKRMAEAKKALTANERRKFYDETAKAVWGYLGDKLNIDGSLLSKEYVTAKLTEKNISPELVKKTFGIVDDCEMALYAPSLAGSDMNKTYEAASAVINELEEGLK